MKILVTCGYRYSGVEAAHRILRASGLADALPSRREGMTVAALHERILKAHGVDRSDVGSVAQICPGKVWEDLAVDLFLGNLGRDNWGWADPAVAWLLEFWKNFDPQIRFVFVYASPRAVAAEALMAGDVHPSQVGEIMTSWAAYQLEVLRFYHRNRDRCLLINALSMATAPAECVSRVARAFDLDLAVPSSVDLEGTQAPSAIASVLVEGLLGAQGECHALYAELEGYADVPEGEVAAPAIGWGSAWGEYRCLTRDLNEAERALRLQTVRFDELALRGSSAEMALSEVNSQIAVQRERIEELGRLVKQSVAEWNAKVKSEADLRSTLEPQASDLIGLKEGPATSTDWERRCRELERELAAQHGILVVAQAAVAEQEGQNALLVEEHEGLLKQLHAVQEELETYFLRCQELSVDALAEPSGPFESGSPWGPMAPAEVRFDMRGEIDGENWYYPESDGRWAGPGLVSTLNLPVLGIGRYQVQIEVADAIKPEILAGMRALINDAPVALVREGKRYPATLTGEFAADDLAADGLWRLTMEFPGVVSPADLGSDDRRHLAVRVRSVRLAAVQMSTV